MDNNILYAILITSLIWILISLAIYISYTKKLAKNLKSVQDDFTSKLENILGERNEELRDSYETGYQDAQDKKEFSVQLTPWKEEVDSSNFFKNRKSVKIGYKYQLFSNGLPCFDPHRIVVEELTVDSLNEQNINKAFKNLELVMNNIPNTGNLAVNILGNGKDLANNLLGMVKKKK
ncbi:MAG: hypothetical protein ACTIJ9_10395 [Aequorivita sp.]